MKLVFKSFIFFLAVSSMSAFSGEAMKPGLWENTFKLKSDDGKLEKAMETMKKQMDSMPAEQKKMMEAMMKKQGASFGANATTLKICLTKEQAEKMQFPKGPNDQGEKCTQEVLKQSAKYIKVKFSCEGSASTKGESEVSFSTPTSFKAKTIMDTTIEGKKQVTKVDQTGKWLSADCGSIMPLSSK